MPPDAGVVEVSSKMRIKKAVVACQRPTKQQ